MTPLTITDKGVVKGNPMLWVITGCMRAGKSKMLLELIPKFQQQYEDHYGVDGNFEVYLCKPNTDIRDGQQIKSRHHKDFTIPCFTFCPNSPKWFFPLNAPDLTKYLVVIDEYHFCSMVVNDLIRELRSRGCSFIIAGVDTRLDGTGFPVMGDLLCMATKITKLEADCTCGEKATRDYFYGKVSTKMIEMVEGPNNVYESMCLGCSITKRNESKGNPG